MKRYLPFVIIGVVMIAAIGVGSGLFRSKQTETPVAGPIMADRRTPSTGATEASAPAPAPVTAAPAQVKSAASLVITVEEFGDYQCPPCGLLHPELKKIKEEYRGRINFIFRNLPLPTIHKNALAAAQAAESARLQDRFWEMHDLLYDNQNAWKDEQDPRPIFLRYARSLGLDLKRFTRDLEGMEVQQQLAADQQRADAQGVKGTPTLLIEGRQLRMEVTNSEGIRKAIDYTFARKGQLKLQP